MLLLRNDRRMFRRYATHEVVVKKAKGRAVKMKALRIYTPGSTATIHYDEIDTPFPAPHEVLVQVHASGISPHEINWATSAGQTRPLPATLGFEVSGVVIELGEDVDEVELGAEVYGLPNFRQGGTQAEYVAIHTDELAPKPKTLTHIEAACVPLSCLTAWQMLFERARVAQNQTVLIHGAAGGVGIFAVQLAHRAGLRVITTATAPDIDFLTELGADVVLDHTASPFEDVVRDVDVVLDLVGGETLKRSWGVLKPNGTLVSIAGDGMADLKAMGDAHGVYGLWHLVHPSREQLLQIAEIIDARQLVPHVASVFPLSQGVCAYEEGLRDHNHGKIVLQVCGQSTIR